MNGTDEGIKRVNAQKKRKPKRRVRWWLLIFPVILTVGIIAAFKVPAMMKDSKIRNLGYSREEAEAIAEAGLSDVILKNEYYSEHLAEAIRTGTLQKDYIPLYVATDTTREFSDRDFLLYRRLADEGYEEDQLMNLFASLKFYELTPLLTFDYQWNEQLYIDDVIACREQNAGGSFVLESSYRQNYRMKYAAEDPHNLNVLVNKNYYLPADFVPEELTPITTEYSVAGMQLTKEAADAAVKMCMDALGEGYAFFISGSYMDYVSIQNAYTHFLNNKGEYYADMQIGKAGFCEFQTGLSINLAATYEKYEDFRTTECYKWLKDNCVRYGFIERYPYGKEDITGCAEDASYYRYLGKELAAKVSASSLTYDEYWCLFLKGWYEETNRPADTLIENALAEVTDRS